MAVLLIRHAQAGSRREWIGDDRERPLSPKGRRQASELVPTLEPFAPQRILSSPYLRCVDTVSPLADRLGLQVESIEGLAEGHGPEALQMIRGFSDEKVALCTHGDVIPDVLVTLADEDRLDLGPSPRQAKGSVWVLETRKGRFKKATYIPPKG